MEEYDPKKIYLGPNGHWSKDFIPKTPIGVPQVHSYWNKAAYDHDCGYEGTREKGWFGWIKNFFNRKKIDDKFHADLYTGVQKVEHSLTDQQIEDAYDYADLVYNSVRTLGWSFYRTGKKDD